MHTILMAILHANQLVKCPLYFFSVPNLRTTVL